MRNNKNIHINLLKKELNISIKEIVRLKNKVGIKHKKIVFTINEANKIRNEFFNETNTIKKKEINLSSRQKIKNGIKKERRSLKFR